MTLAQAAVAPDATLASGWSMQPTPDIAGPASATLSGVSCTNGPCVAVGSYVNTTDIPVPLAAKWTGTAWAITTPPAPTGASQTRLSAVSCPSGSACAAVGYYYNAAGTRLTLSEQWTGTAWMVTPTPNPAGASSSVLSGLSCTSASACIAVGYYITSSGIQVALAERWNGAAWSIMTTSIPSGATASSLSGVSCMSASACTAVGYYGTSTATVTLAEEWNGTAWTVQSTPNPPSGYWTDVSASFNGVSCTNSTLCTAVGSVTNKHCVKYPKFPPFCTTQVLTLAEAWNGAGWTIQATPNPTTRSVLSSVSCTTSGCTAAGQSNGATLIEQSSGTSWTVPATPTISGGSALNAVSCTSAGACTAVGQDNNLTLAELSSGTSWAIQPTPTPSGPASRQLSGVSCTTATNCTAVGTYTDAYGTQLPLVEGWDGTLWTIQPVATPRADGVLYGVSCTSFSACTAVGQSNGMPLAEHWNGTTWTAQAPPTPSGATSASLSGVSCTTASACTAVGQSNGMPLAEQWNGTSWTVQTPPAPSGSVSASLYSVSCTTSAACTAVGYFGNGPSPDIIGDAPLAESWNGSTWALQTPPNPNQATSGTLTGISCISPQVCTAVGGYDDQNTTPVSYATLAEQLNGSTWTIQPTPTPTGSAGSALSGVSCTTNSACTAVGYYNDNAYPEISGETPLAENWNGTSWSVQPTPNPPATDVSTLAQVSCASATACTAVGGLSFFYSYPVNVALAERYSG